jgi:polyisoprenoid-binding protein YceI
MKQKMMRLFAILFFSVSAISIFAKTETYTIDSVHSSITFKIRHFFSKVTGNFNEFEGQIIVDRENMEKSQTKASIDMNSINTRNEKRDNHLRSEDFFDVEKFPTMTFQSKKWAKVSENEFDVTGDLSLHGITKEVVLKVKSLGFGDGPDGVYLSGWEGSTKIKKSDFGITYGGATLGDEVEIMIEVESRRES